jgi:hypothetical protein
MLIVDPPQRPAIRRAPGQMHATAAVLGILEVRQRQGDQASTAAINRRLYPFAASDLTIDSSAENWVRSAKSRLAYN